MVECLKAVVGNNPKVLILGSMPGAESLKAQQYYAFKQNRFWKIILKYLKSDFTENYEKRIEVLTRANIALWDTINCCERENSSLDSKITKEIPNDIRAFLQEYSSIKAIILNGQKAEKVYKKFFSDITLPIAVTLPSTSPANASKDFDTLYERWEAVLSVYL